MRSGRVTKAVTPLRLAAEHQGCDEEAHRHQREETGYPVADADGDIGPGVVLSPASCKLSVVREVHASGDTEQAEK